MQAHKNNINNKIRELSYEGNIQHKCHIYGGFTEYTIEERTEQHIRDNQPCGCDETWKYEKVTTYTLTEDLEHNKNYISEIENHLINSLNEVFDKHCINARNVNGTISQLGGNGLNIKINNVGDKIIFYIFYGKINPTYVFI